MRKKLAIVSSYNTVCGNASYTHVLKEALSQHFDTDVIAINHKLLSNAHPAAKTRQRIYLKEIAEQLRQYDCVNIQFESILYGNSMKVAHKNILPLINASKSLLFTIHRVQNPALESPLWKTAIRNGTKIMKTLRAYNLSRQNKSFKKIIEALKDHKRKGHVVSAVVHTAREREILELYYNFNDVVDFPITFLNKQQITATLSDRQAVRNKVFEKYAFDQSSKYIGIFGFLSENKGHHVAVDAMNFLPPEYKLAIFGAQHPFAILEYDLGEGLKKTSLFHNNNNAYISSLIETVNALNSKEQQDGALPTPDKVRARFLGSLSDADFIEAMVAMDFIVVPYFETGQGGSGNASLALELETKAIFSRTFAFMELARYYPDCFEITDIGNAPELAQKIYTWNKDVTAAQKRATSIYCIEHNALVHKEAMENGAESARKLKLSLSSLQPTIAS
jgi:glycosyltransferase involved in cell wall biosynthesis